MKEDREWHQLFERNPETGEMVFFFREKCRLKFCDGEGKQRSVEGGTPHLEVRDDGLYLVVEEIGLALSWAILVDRLLGAEASAHAAGEVQDVVVVRSEAEVDTN